MCERQTKGLHCILIIPISISDSPTRTFQVLGLAVECEAGILLNDEMVCKAFQVGIHQSVVLVVLVVLVVPHTSWGDRAWKGM